jgi:hypothetical protein
MYLIGDKEYIKADDNNALLATGPPVELSRRLLNPCGDITSGNPSKSMMVIGLSLPTLRLRQKRRYLVYDVY